MIRTLLPCLAVSIFAGCTCGTPDAPPVPPTSAAVAPTPPPSTEVEIAAPPPSSAAPTAHAAPLDTPEARARVGEFRTALTEGRSLAQSGDQEAAVAAFRRALAAAESPRARCELGWALFRAGHVEDAAHELDRALAGLHDEAIPSDQRGTFGACLYNRARVAEAGADTAGAAAFYRRSLAIRPNATAQAALDALAAPPPAEPACTQICAGPLPTREALRAALGAAFEAAHADAEFYCGEHGASEWESIDRAITPTGAYLEAHLSVFDSGDYCYAGPERSIGVIEVRLANGWSGCGLVEAEGGVNESVHIDYDDALVVRGVELAARPRVLSHDTEGAGDCMGCMDECEECACDDDCDYETLTTFERVVRVDGERLVPGANACLL